MKSSRWLWVLLAAVIGAAALAGGAFYRIQEREFRRRVEAELAAVARLKAAEVAQWRRERFEQALDLMKRPLLVARLADWISRRRSEHIPPAPLGVRCFKGVRRLGAGSPGGPLGGNAPGA